MTPFGILKVSAGRLGIPKRLGHNKLLRSPVALKPLISLGFRHKKRRPWTSLDDEVVGRGNLNGFGNLLIYNVNNDFNFWLEYQLEYRSVLRGDRRVPL
ncbi:hypothetical protein [Pseudomonas sp. G2-4]|uniref:hypothetical protein n=1 Tax=Pseudomonas sp. G2-4 TaxID=1506334 RepID=UPI0024B8B10F|nr:hypothetical protein [Pseudomonas sp. G2-4]WHS61127.1 hypothetical protein QNH97_03530 [Pseudomonas sp. G2-4]